MRSNGWIGWILGFLLAVVVPAARPAWADTVAYLETNWDGGASAYRWDYSITSMDAFEDGDWCEITGLYDVRDIGVDLGNHGHNKRWDATEGEDWARWIYTGPGEESSGTLYDFYYVSGVRPGEHGVALWHSSEGEYGELHGSDVPEPTTFILFGIGSLGLAALARRRRSAQEGA